MSVKALGKGRRLRANGAFLQLRERFFGVTIARTVAQVIEATKARVAEIDAEQGRRCEEMAKAFALAPPFGGDVEAVRRLVEQYDVIQLTMNGVILNKPVRELIRHAMVMNLVDQLRASYVSISEQLQAEVDAATKTDVAQLGTFGADRVMNLYFHDMSLLLPVDFEEIESHIHWPMSNMVDGEYAVQAMQMSPDMWPGQQRRRPPLGGGRLPPQEIGTFAELETTLRAHAKAEGEQDA